MYKNMSNKEYRRVTLRDGLIMGAMTGISSTLFVIAALKWAFII